MLRWRASVMGQGDNMVELFRGPENWNLDELRRMLVVVYTSVAERETHRARRSPEMFAADRQRTYLRHT